VPGPDTFLWAPGGPRLPRLRRRWPASRGGDGVMGRLLRPAAFSTAFFVLGLSPSA